MTQLRSVNTAFWDDGYIVDLSPNEKLVFLYLLTNPVTTLAGCYQIRLRKIAFDVGLNEKTVGKILEKFQADNKIFFRDGWLVLKSFHKNQNLNANMGKAAAKVILSAPVWARKYIENALKDYGTIPEWFPKGSATIPEPSKEVEREDEVEDEKEGKCEDACTNKIQDWDWPLKPFLEAFPDYLPDRLTPDQVGTIEAAIRPGDEDAWIATIQHYQQNFNPTLNRYLPDKIGNVLSVFKAKKAELLKNGNYKNGSSRSGESSQAIANRIGADAEF